MDSSQYEDFQNVVTKCLVRHKSILDVLSKLQEATAKTNRAVAKSVTSCGCINIHATKQEFPRDTSFSDLKDYIETHVKGDLCGDCQDVIESELGQTLFYLAALSELLDLDLDDVMKKEYRRINALGLFKLA